MSDLLVDISNTIMFVTFYMVVFLMLPISKRQKRQQMEFKKFLFGGFLDKDHLESAIFDKNPEATLKERQFIRKKLAKLNWSTQVKATSIIMQSIV